jgi:hypothetical protein
MWMVANGLILVAIAAWLLKPGTENLPDGGGKAAPAAPQAGSAGPSLGAVRMPTKADVMGIKGKRFGLSSPDVPWSGAEFERLSSAAGASPSMVMVFVKWTEEFQIEPVELSYQRGALPVLSWEPWAGIKSGISQPKYALAKIINGSFDAYVTRFATAVRDARWPVAIRLAHEMNGDWYPWSESRSGNKKGQYVKAWRHVHDVFRKVGATNVIWIWSPNILRPVPNVSLSALYPGDAYVDWAGMVGYAVRESTAAPVFQPTITALRKVTSKPMVITETGVQPSRRKARWIKDFFAWLPERPEIIGFIWFEYNKEQGGNEDWRFTETSASAKAFRSGIKSLRPAPGPRAG